MPTLTLIVPTKNRQHTAIQTVAEAARLAPASELEIVVHDCSDEPLLRDRLIELSLLDRVVYRYVDRPVSMTENWNLAMSYATGEWVTIIGDDDALAPGAVLVAKWATPGPFQAVKSGRYSYYGHPDMPDRDYAARLRVPPFTGAVHEKKIEPLIVENARTGDTYADLPMVYHNLVRRSVLERVRAKAGHYFDGLAPDVYSAFAIGALIDRFVIVDYPLTIVGASARSNTNRVAVGEGHLHAAEYTDFRFSWMMPESWILPASIPDNVVRALTDVGRTDLLEHIDVARVFARTIHAEPRRAREHLRKYIRVRRAQQRGVATGVALVGIGVMVKVFLQFARKLRRTPPPEGVWFENVQSLGAAIATQNQWLTDHGIAPPV